VPPERVSSKRAGASETNCVGTKSTLTSQLLVSALVVQFESLILVTEHPCADTWGYMSAFAETYMVTVLPFCTAWLVGVTHPALFVVTVSVRIRTQLT
jgi:hypothetical protein